MYPVPCSDCIQTGCLCSDRTGSGSSGSGRTRSEQAGPFSRTDSKRDPGPRQGPSSPSMAGPCAGLCD